MGADRSALTLVISKSITIPSVPGSNETNEKFPSAVLSYKRDAAKNWLTIGCSGLLEHAAEVRRRRRPNSRLTLPFLLFFLDEPRDGNNLVVLLDIDQLDSLRCPPNRAY